MESQLILDNPIAQGKVGLMIVVMPVSQDHGSHCLGWYNWSDPKLVQRNYSGFL
jgi:hypothetical protein